MRAIDADNLQKIKFHALPYTHITPTDCNAESYKLGWNDAIDAIMSEQPTIEPERKKGKKIVKSNGRMGYWACDKCGETIHPDDNFCPNCGARMTEEDV